jgi:hypothetical protein
VAVATGALSDVLVDVVDCLLLVAVVVVITLCMFLCRRLNCKQLMPVCCCACPAGDNAEIGQINKMVSEVRPTC